MALCLAALPPSSEAQVVVTKGRIEVAISPLGGAEGPQATQLLRTDLERSGVLSIVSADKAQYLVGGSVSGGGLQGNVTERRSSQAVLQRSFSSGSRRSAHEFADAIVEQLTGQKGIATTRIAFMQAQGRNKELFVMDLDGAAVTQVTRDNVLAGGPSFAPDGQRVAYMSYRGGWPDVYVVDLRNGQRQRVASFPGLNSGAHFSPDGSQIALTLSKDGNPEIYLMSASGGGASRLTRTRGTESSPSWSPDGRTIVYNSDDRGSPQLYTLPTSGGAPQRLTTGVLYATEPDWSPDGKKIAFNARIGGQFQICVLDLASGQTAQLTQGGDNEDPSWCRNSRHLVFSRGGKLFLLDTIQSQTYSIENGLAGCTEPSASK